MLTLIAGSHIFSAGIGSHERGGAGGVHGHSRPLQPEVVCHTPCIAQLDEDHPTAHLKTLSCHKQTLSAMIIWPLKGIIEL